MTNFILGLPLNEQRFAYEYLLGCLMYLYEIPKDRLELLTAQATEKTKKVLRTERGMS